MPRGVFSPCDDFERHLDRMFDDLLIQPWRQAARAEQPAIVVDREAEYEVRLWTEDFRPDQIEVDVSQFRLTVRARRGAGLAWERWFTFIEAVQVDRVAARWARNLLTVNQPKQTRG